MLKLYKQCLGFAIVDDQTNQSVYVPDPGGSFEVEVFRAHMADVVHPVEGHSVVQEFLEGYWPDPQDAHQLVPWDGNGAEHDPADGFQRFRLRLIGGITELIEREAPMIAWMLTDPDDGTVFSEIDWMIDDEEHDEWELVEGDLSLYREYVRKARCAEVRP